jgi:hypothetical protein
MINWFNNEIEKYGNLIKKELSPYDVIKKNGAKYLIKSYDVNNLGTLSTLEIKAMLGLMKVTSIIFTPLNKDMPILSFDLIKVFGKTTLLIDLYNTNIDESNYPSLMKLKEGANLPINKLEPRWYDVYKFNESVSFKGKGIQKQAIEFSKQYILEYFSIMEKSKDSDPEIKRANTKKYVDELFSKGGPAVDQFKKLIGDKPTYDLFTHYIFGAEK